MAIAIGLLKTLLELSRARKSGVIDAALSGARVRLYLEAGEIVAADEGTVGETLGRLLVKEKVLTEDQYSAAIEWMADLRAKGRNARLGEVFVELKMLTPQQVHAALSAQVQQKVVRALTWKTAQPTFIECHGPLEIAGRYPTPLEPLVIAALRIAQLDELEALFTQAKGRYIELVEPERLKAFELQAKEQAFAETLDGSRTAAELLAAPDAAEPAVILAALLLFDCLALHSHTQAPRRPSIPRQPPAIRRVSRPEMKGAAPAPTSSARSLLAPTPKEKERIKSVAARLRASQAAKRPLSKPPVDGPYELAIPTPQTPVAPVARLLAEKAFQAGKSLVRANELAKALVELRRATVMFPAVEYELWASWAALRVEGPSPKRIEELRRTAERALELDPRLGFGWFVLGHLAMRDKDTTRANELFARARALEPATVDELRDVRLRDVAPPPKSFELAKRPATLDTKGPMFASLAQPIMPAAKQPEPEPKPVAIAKVTLSAPKLAADAPPPRRPSVPRPTPSDPSLKAAREQKPSSEPELEDIDASWVPETKRGVAPEDKRDVAPQQPLSKPGRGWKGGTSGKLPRVDAAQQKNEEPPEEAPISPRTPGLIWPEPAAALESARLPTTDRSPSAETVVADKSDPREVRGDEVRALRPREEASIENGNDVVGEDHVEDLPPSSPDGAPPTEPSAPDLRKSLVPKEPRSIPPPLPQSVDHAKKQRSNRPVIYGAIGVAAIAVAIAWARGAFEPAAKPTPDPALIGAVNPSTSASAPLPTSTKEDATIEDLDDAEVDAASDAPASDATASDAATIDGSEAAAVAANGNDASSDATDAGAGAIAPTMGALTFPPAADSHRVWVDGRFVGAPPGEIIVPCGKHVVRVGSAGRDQNVDIPCGGRIAIEYP